MWTAHPNPLPAQESNIRDCKSLHLFIGDLHLPVQLIHTLPSAHRCLLEQVPWVNRSGVTRSEPEDPPASRLHPPDSRRQIQQKSTGGSYGIIADSLDGKHSQFCFQHRSYCTRITKHSVVIGDQALVAKSRESYQQITIPELRKVRMNTTQWYQFRVRYESLKAVQNRFREVVVKRQVYQAARLRSRSIASTTARSC